MGCELYRYPRQRDLNLFKLTAHWHDHCQPDCMVNWELLQLIFAHAINKLSYTERRNWRGPIHLMVSLLLVWNHHEAFVKHWALWFPWQTLADLHHLIEAMCFQNAWRNTHSLSVYYECIHVQLLYCHGRLTSRPRNHCGHQKMTWSSNWLISSVKFTRVGAGWMLLLSNEYIFLSRVWLGC